MTHTQARHVVFGTGPLGRAVMDELVRRGETVRMVNRRGEGQVPEGVELVRADAYSPAAVGDAPRVGGCGGGGSRPGQRWGF